ncbi:MFS transporter [Clostridium disporicum]|uniref:MFS transporter n=1 Tax=Clostridium disporicum TaxID=84024 RepID=UPI0028FDF5B1|nr:glycoside-pentoside-hexuronide (GPH):cation symporter [Clostridium celatum]
MEAKLKVNVNEKMNPNAKLSFKERLGYGIGDYSGNLIYSSISAFLLLYYTNVVNADAAMAASIIAISKIFDGISDLIMGRIVDKTKSKYGKARPWILRLCVPFAVSAVLMFSVPESLSGKYMFIYMFLTYNLVSTVFFTGINVPYAAMNGLMTTNQYERGLLGNFRMLLATAGTMTVNTFVLKMVVALGNGDQYNRAGWTKAFVVIGIATVVLNLFMFATCKERVVEESSSNGDKKEEVSFIKSLKGLFTNKYWLLMVGVLFVMYFMMSCFFGSAAYYAQYVIGDINKFAPISNALSMAQIATMFCTPFIMKKIGKRNTMLIGTGVATIGFVFTGVAGAGVSLQVVASVIKGMGFGCSAAVMFGLLQDAITYGQWKNGFGSSGMGNAASSFCMKVGSGIGTAALGWILAAGKFDATLAIQSSSAMNAIGMSFIWIPAITMGIGVVCMCFYDLDKKYDKIIADLEAGRYMNSK